MDSKFIPDDIAQFILNEIDSVAYMEALVLLRQYPARKWSIPALAESLYTGQNQVAEIVARLCAQGIAIVDNADSSLYIYQPRSGELTKTIDRLADIYAKHLVPVTNLIHSQPKRQIGDQLRMRSRGQALPTPYATAVQWEAVS
jgi:hypothetical protein